MPLYRRLWRGDVDGALVVLETQRPEAKSGAKLDELIVYLRARASWIPNYRQRRIDRQYIGSAYVEKANDLIVARRQKNRGMQWSEATAEPPAQRWQALMEKRTYGHSLKFVAL